MHLHYFTRDEVNVDAARRIAHRFGLFYTATTRRTPLKAHGLKRVLLIDIDSFPHLAAGLRAEPEAVFTHTYSPDLRDRLVNAGHYVSRTLDQAIEAIVERLGLDSSESPVLVGRSQAKNLSVLPLNPVAAGR